MSSCMHSEPLNPVKLPPMAERVRRGGGLLASYEVWVCGRSWGSRPGRGNIKESFLIQPGNW